jgi:hypothetical protein
MAFMGFIELEPLWICIISEGLMELISEVDISLICGVAFFPHVIIALLRILMG